MTGMKEADWLTLTHGLLHRYDQTFRALMAAYDVLKEHSIPFEAVAERLKQEPFASMKHPASSQLEDALRREDQKSAEKLLLSLEVPDRPN
jgi:hypothetical protein